MARRTIPEMEALGREILPASVRKQIYATRRNLGRTARQRLSLHVACPTYLQDPAVAERNPELGVVEMEVRWEPGLADGPTSARIAVVDYNGDTGMLEKPVRWDAKLHAFVDAGGKPLKEDDGSPQFRQLSTWTIVQSIIEYYEHSRALGRPVPWAFEGSRLILVPHAGEGANAFYDRHSKSLQFYVYGDPGQPRYTCLSRDVVAHETGHAILDGIRPHYFELSSQQTAAFHEFVADMTAILTSLRDNELRRKVGEAVGADLTRDNVISGIGAEIGEYLHGTHNAPLRSAKERLRLDDLEPGMSPHSCSRVLTGAMFEILCRVAAGEAKKVRRNGKLTSPRQALWTATDNFGRMTLQALDLCPPVDVQFVDYARAVLRNDVLVNPETSASYRELILEVFHESGLCERSDCTLDDYVEGRCDLSFDEGEDLPTRDIYHDVGSIAGSRTGAYYFVDDNRADLRIPAHQDVHVSDLYVTRKMGRADLQLPQEIVLLYVWRERLELDGERFRSLRGESVDLLCGGTVVFDGRGNLRSWMRKPGTEFGPAKGMSPKQKRLAEREQEIGRARRDRLLEHLAYHATGGRFAFDDGHSDLGLPIPPVVARRQGSALRLERVPHLRDVDERDDLEDSWQTSF